ncbi:uncharacterized protein [Antedon mediterranea]|uniref:uncharacterized protein n=1 Tax=Antedon mediterranea TaxID=105859 RepID=UPI003AF72B22
MSYPDTFEPQSKMTSLLNTNDVVSESSIKRTPLQTLSPNSPSLLLRSRRSSTKRRSPLFDKFVQVSQSTPICRSSWQFNAINDNKKQDAVTYTNLPLWDTPITYTKTPEVSVGSSNFSLLEDMSIPEVTTSIPSLGHINMPCESFEIHNDVDSSKSSNEICSTCDESFVKSDNKENDVVPSSCLYEDISSDDNDLLFHSRNSNSKIYLVPALEDDIAIENLEDKEPASCETSLTRHTTSSSNMCQTSSSNECSASSSLNKPQISSLSASHTSDSSLQMASSSSSSNHQTSNLSLSERQMPNSRSDHQTTSDSSLSELQTSSQFGDNEDSDGGGAAADLSQNASCNKFEQEEAFELSLEEIQYLIENEMFLHSPTGPRPVACSSDGYIPVSLQAYEPEEGETDQTDESSLLQDDDISDSSLSPGEIGSSLFSDKSSTSSESGRRSSTSSNTQNLRPASDSLHDNSASQEDSCSGESYEVASLTSDTESHHDVEEEDDDDDFKTANMTFSSPEETGKSQYFKDYIGVCDDLLAVIGESDMGVSSSAGVQIREDLPLTDNVAESGVLCDENWSLRVPTDSLTYQNEVDLWECHALQNDLVDYFGATNNDLVPNNLTKDTDLHKYNSALQQDVEDLEEPSHNLGEIFENVNSDVHDAESCVLSTYEPLECVIENLCFNLPDDVESQLKIKEQHFSSADCHQVITDKKMACNIENLEKPASETGKTELEMEKLALEMEKTGLEMEKPASEMENSASEMEKLALEMEKTGLEMEKPASEMENSASEMEKLALEMEKTGLEMEKPASEMENSASEMEKLELEMEKTGLEMEKPASEMENSASEMEKLALEMEKTGLEMGKPASEMEKSASEMEKLALEMEKTGLEMEKPASEMENSASEMEKLELEMEKTGLEMEKPASEMENSASEIEKLALEMEKTGLEMEKPASEMENSASEIEKLALEMEKTGLEMEKPASEMENSASEIEKLALEMEKTGLEMEKPASEMENSASEMEKPASEIEKPVSEMEKPESEMEKPAPEVEKTELEMETPALENIEYVHLLVDDDDDDDEWENISYDDEDCLQEAIAADGTSLIKNENQTAVQNEYIKDSDRQPEGRLVQQKKSIPSGHTKWSCAIL